MSLALKLYGAAEAVAGRRTLWRIGRWLYLGARRELRNDPHLNGEYRLQAWMVAALVANETPRPWVFCDVGANLGKWTERLLQTLGRGGVDDAIVYAFEPAPGQFAALAERVSGGRCDIRLDRRGLAAEPGRAVFEITGESSGNSGIRAGSDAGGAHEIEVTTLDVVRAESQLRRMDFVKVDTEGNDFNVIQGARGLFDAEAIGALQFEYNWRWIPFGYTLRNVFDFLEGRPYTVGRLTQEGLEFYSTWHPELDRFIETNYVIVRRDLVPRLPGEMMNFDLSNMPRRTAVGQATGRARRKG